MTATAAIARPSAHPARGRHGALVNGCIQFISSRDQCLENALASLWDAFNRERGYPVYVYYFDDIYDDPALRERVRREIDPNVTFLAVPYRTPAHVPESEQFHNRRDLWYVQHCFPPRRKGYLHMCHFNVNVFGYPGTRLHLHDWVINLDDEGGFQRPLAVDPFATMLERGLTLAAFRVVRRAPHQGMIDTRIGLWDLTRDYLAAHRITPASPELRAVLASADPERAFHDLAWMDSYVVGTELFRSASWRRWIDAVNRDGGIYKYRWGDNEIFSLYSHMHLGVPVDLGLVDDGTYRQDMFKQAQELAPGVKDLSR